MGPRGSDGAGDHEVDPLDVVPSAPELERALASVTGVATAEVHTSPGGSDRLRLSLTAGAEPEVVAWSVAATLRERFGIALDPGTIALRPSEGAPAPAPATSSVPPPPPPRPPATSAADGFAGDPALVDAARAAMRTRAARSSDEAEAAGTVAATPLTPPRRPVDPGDVPVAEGDADEVDGRRPRPAPRRGTPPGATPTPVAGTEPSVPPGSLVSATAEPAPTGGQDASGTGRRRRAAIRELVARPEGDDLAVLATLRLADREATGQARGLGTRRGRWRVIAEATLRALGELTGGQLRADVDHVTVLAFPDLAHVTVSVTVLGDHGEERFLGAAMLRDDQDRAVMRATLDAVNRRVEPWLADGERSA